MLCTLSAQACLRVVVSEAAASNVRIRVRAGTEDLSCDFARAARQLRPSCMRGARQAWKLAARGLPDHKVVQDSFGPAPLGSVARD